MAQEGRLIEGAPVTAGVAQGPLKCVGAGRKAVSRVSKSNAF